MDINMIWKNIPGYEGHYQVSEVGAIKSLARAVFCNKGTRGVRNKKEMFLKTRADNHGYVRVILLLNGQAKNCLVHRLVALAFIPNDLKKREVNHINGVKADNRVSNLEWCSSSENQLHAVRTGLQKITPPPVKCNEANPMSKKVLQLNRLGEVVAEYPSANEAARRLNGNGDNITATARGEQKTAYGFIWKYSDN